MPSCVADLIDGSVLPPDIGFNFEKIVFFAIWIGERGDIIEES